jgi:hypothetical protein
MRVGILRRGSWAARLGLSTVLAILALAAAAAPASADHTEATIFDPGGIVNPGLSAAYRTRTLDRISNLGADTVRVLVPWRWIAPQPDRLLAPAGFDPSDPGDYPQRSFDALDQIVREAQTQDLRVLMTPTGPAPNWASGSAVNDHVKPDADQFGKFVEALGNRYSGCTAASCESSSPPPRVTFWSVWNEPNLALFLRPQYVHGRPVSGRIYRRLYLAARRGLRDSGHASDPVLIGETAPSRGAVSTAPIDFLRQVLCLNRGFQRRRGCAPLKAAGWAQHPYTPGVAPWQRPRSSSGISIGSLDRLVRALRLAAGAGATVGRLPVYVTEFGIESHPKPSALFGLSQQRQVEYLGIAELLLYRDPWVRSYSQYLMGDDAGNPLDHLTFNTGLRFSDDRPKLAYSAFPITVAVRRTGSGGVEIWGHLRPGNGIREVEIRYRDSDGVERSLGSVETNADGYFELGSEYRPGREWGAAGALADGRLLAGPLVRAYRFPLAGAAYAFDL